MYKPDDFAWLGERRKNVYSQWGEDGILEAIFARIGTANQWCCECGAADGVFFSNTKALIDKGWSAVLIEADAEQFKKLRELYSEKIGQIVYTFNNRLDAVDYTFDRILSAVSAPLDLDLLVVDVDGQDYWLFNSMFKYRPRVVIVEYDPAADKGFIPPLNGDGQAGLNAIINLGIGKYYWPVAITQTNVVFVQQELCPKLIEPEKHRHESVSGNTACIHCGLKGVWPLVERHEFRGSHDRWCEVCNQPDRSPIHVWPLAEKPVEPKTPQPLLAAVMSTPRFGPLATMDCIFGALMPLGVPLLRGEGAFWHQTLERAIERAVKGGVKYVVTFDYDSIFDGKQYSNDVAKLVCLMEDNPSVDCIVPAQMKREGGPLLATTDQEIRLLDPLVPITQGHFGLTIFKASAFTKIPKPWFRDFPNDAGEWNENRVDADIHFWRQAMDAGLNVQMSLDVMVGHIETVVTWPGQDLRPVYQPLNTWREQGRPAEAFNRQRVLDAVKANPALLYGPKLEMGG